MYFLAHGTMQVLESRNMSNGQQMHSLAWTAGGSSCSRTESKSGTESKRQKARIRRSPVFVAVKPVRQPLCVRPKAARGNPVRRFMGAMVAMAMISVSFAESVEPKINKDERQPTPGNYKSKTEIELPPSIGKPTAIKDMQICEEQSRISNANAMKRAFDNFHEVNETEGCYFKEAETFFCEGVITPEQRETSSKIRIGTDCSGMEAPIQAARNLKLHYDHVFSSEIDKKVVQTINANFPPQKLYADLTTRDNARAENVDIYVAGFPCQPFSGMGKQEGFDDSQGRGTIFFNILDYTETKRPKVFIL